METVKICLKHLVKQYDKKDEGCQNIRNEIDDTVDYYEAQKRELKKLMRVDQNKINERDGTIARQTEMLANVMKDKREKIAEAFKLEGEK